jgi:hypothetical protein
MVLVEKCQLEHNFSKLGNTSIIPPGQYTITAQFFEDRTKY